ncbi:hypothetical protein NDU88_001499 [Pleurodeles waltl]|uniref:Uncharacterized protein n=1 Tax=Pleurodeles waltl TaxID=8319 RepID=A0AAV7NEE0_PLEWA|nr:hypothetical protein NDU88_001499 [Pleurodeles waltl]
MYDDTRKNKCLQGVVGVPIQLANDAQAAQAGRSSVIPTQEERRTTTDEFAMKTVKGAYQTLGLNMNSSILHSLVDGDPANIGDAPTLSEKGTQAEKPQLDKLVPMLFNPATQESIVYSLDNLFFSPIAASNLPLVVHDSLDREYAINPRAVPFRFFFLKITPPQS